MKKWKQQHPELNPELNMIDDKEEKEGGERRTASEDEEGGGRGEETETALLRCKLP